MMHVNHRALDTGVGQAVEHIIDQWLAADLQQWFRDVTVERPHPRTEPGGQYHRAARRGDGSQVAHVVLLPMRIRSFSMLARVRCTIRLTVPAPDAPATAAGR